MAAGSAAITSRMAPITWAEVPEAPRSISVKPVLRVHCLRHIALAQVTPVIRQSPPCADSAASVIAA